MRNRITTRVGIFALALALCTAPASQAQAFEFPDLTGGIFDDVDWDAVLHPIEVGFDAVIVRPLTMTTIVIGGVLLVPAVALSAAEGRDSWDSAIELFVTIPYEDAIQRELGDF